MRNKSVVNIKKSYAEEIGAGRFSYGAILAESYWKKTKDGFIVESQPTTSELLNTWFWPFRPSINNNRVYINKWFTGVVLELIDGPGGIHIERLVLKPDLDVDEVSEDFISRECWANFRQFWGSND